MSREAPQRHDEEEGPGGAEPDPRRTGYRPPRTWERILVRVLPESDRDLLQRELSELYASLARRKGEQEARRRYRREVLAFAVRRPGGMARRLGTDLREVLGGWARGVARSARSLGRTPGFTLAATLSLALGIGASALIFSVADRALIRPLPYPDAHRLVTVMEGWGSSLGTLEILQRRMTTLSGVGGAWDATGMTLQTAGGEARRVTAARVSPGYLQALRPTVAAGRLFRPREAQPGEGRVAILGWEFWQREFGGDPAAVDALVTLDDVDFRVVGVLPRGFDLPSGRNDLWVPAEMDPSDAGLFWGVGAYSLVGRLAPGATPDQVRDELLRVGEEVRLANPLWTPPLDFWDGARITPLHEARSRWARTPLLILLGAAGVLLLVVCANVANLLLSRGLARRRDQAVRASLGAAAGRLAAGQLTEVLVLTAAGTGLGLLFAAGGLEGLRPLLPPEIPGAAEARLDLRVLAFTAGLALVTALTAGALPAFRVAGRSPGDLLREGGRSQIGGSNRRHVTRVLVATQVAAAVLLVTGAGLLARSLVLLSRVDPGFALEGRVTARLDLPPGLDDDPAARADYLLRLEETLEADGAIGEVTLASTIPFGPEFENMAAFIPGVTPDPNNLPVVHHRRVGPDFFRVMDIPVVAGRGFTREDGLDAPLVAVVDRTFAREFFEGRNPVGRTVRYPWRGAPDIRIVGVVGATHPSDLSQAPEPTLWMPLDQMGLGAPDHAVVVARAAASPEAALGAIQTRTRTFDGGVAVSELASYPELLRDSLAASRLLTLLLLGFSGITLVLGCIGVYGVVAFSVRERVREIGVRVALGADPVRIRRRILREGLLLAVPGAVVGMILALVGSRALESVLFGVTAWDPLAFLLAPLVMVLSALLAVHLPARRATRVDPVTVLRQG